MRKVCLTLNIEGNGARGRRGFTLIELVTVLVFLSVLSTAAIQTYSASARKSRENSLRSELSSMRSAIDRYYLDRLREDPASKHLDRFPKNLQELVDKKYLRRVPSDPVSGETTWEIIIAGPGHDRVFDVRSAARGMSTENDLYTDW